MATATAPLPTPLMATQAQDPSLYRMSYDLYARLAQLELFRSEDHVVLLDGLLVNQMSKGPEHSVIVHQGQAVLQSALPAGWCVRLEQPIALRDGRHGDSAPEPDLVIAFGMNRRYLKQHRSSRRSA